MFGLVPVFYCTYFKIPSLEWSVKSRFPVLDCIGTPFACMDCIEAPWAWIMFRNPVIGMFGTPFAWFVLGHPLLGIFWDTFCLKCFGTPCVSPAWSQAVTDDTCLPGLQKITCTLFQNRIPSLLGWDKMSSTSGWALFSSQQAHIVSLWASCRWFNSV